MQAGAFCFNAMKTISSEKIRLACFHCGEDCPDEPVQLQGKAFCCDGCRTVYGILNDQGMCDYYSITAHPGTSQRASIRKGKFAFLDDQTVQNALISFREGNQSRVSFYLPQMHCSSCIWLLENLRKLNDGVISSQVQFAQKDISIVFDHTRISLRQLAELLTSVGYEPHISLNDLQGKPKQAFDQTRALTIGIAGFCFGNIMLLSFPEYLGLDTAEDNALRSVLSWINLGLSFPVLYASREFFITGIKGLRSKFLNIDLPIALAILITFSRSAWEIITGTGAGYLDTMSGIVFFMLVGRYFQDKTYNTISFDRDYTSFFPIAVTKINPDQSEQSVPVSALKIGDLIRIFHEEVLPADAMLIRGKACIDYSFVTGESVPVDKEIGELLYAGGRQSGGLIEVQVVREVSQSYLTRLWNDRIEKDKARDHGSFVHRVSTWFTIILFSIAVGTAVFWGFHDPTKLWPAVTAILIVACPCALLLSTTFTNGNAIRLLQDQHLYLRNANVMESLRNATVLVFDKTGTITLTGSSRVRYEGAELTSAQENVVFSMVRQSAHPLSRAIAAHLRGKQVVHLRNFSEIKGKGITAETGDEIWKLGNAGYTDTISEQTPDGIHVYVSCNGIVLGNYVVETIFRPGLAKTIKELSGKYRIAVLSGDTDREKPILETIFPEGTIWKFSASPEEKRDFVRALQASGEKVIMIGDGLNDAGALREATAGIAITDDRNNFSPACDGILEGRGFAQLPAMLSFARRNRQVIMASFCISLLYNIIGLSFAVSANLSPVIAAILMPLSSISIVSIGTIGSFLNARSLGLVSGVNKT